MANHYRETIRKKIAELLEGNISFNSAALDVYLTRLVPFFKAQLPCLAVYFLTEAADEESTAPRIYKRLGDLKIEIIAGEIPLFDEHGDPLVSDVKTIEDLLDYCAMQIEEVLDEDPGIGLVPVLDSRLMNTSFVYKEEGEKIFCSCILSYEVKYINEAFDDTPLDDFKREKTGYDVDGPAGHGPDLPEMKSDSTIQSP